MKLKFYLIKSVQMEEILFHHENNIVYHLDLQIEFYRFHLHRIIYYLESFLFDCFLFTFKIVLMQCSKSLHISFKIKWRLLKYLCFQYFLLHKDQLVFFNFCFESQIVPKNRQTNQVFLLLLI